MPAQKRLNNKPEHIETVVNTNARASIRALWFKTLLKTLCDIISSSAQNFSTCTCKSCENKVTAEKLQFPNGWLFSFNINLMGCFKNPKNGIFKD